MRLNGGIIGANNRPTNRSAGGIWKWSEQQTHVGYNTFPMFVDGYNFTKIQNSQTKYTGRYATIGIQEPNPAGLYFKPDDGTKIYVVGASTNVHQYTLSTGWNANTATYDNIKFSIATQTTSPSGVFFKPTGDKMYICADGSDVIYQYSLSTSWNVATASYDNKSFSVASQDILLKSIHLKPDGYKFWALGATNDRVFQYSIGTQWDISTATYDNISYYIGTQELASSGLFFKDDGTIMYVTGDTSRTIFQYSLGTAWNVATAVYSNNVFDIADATSIQSITSIQDIYIKSDRIYTLALVSSSATDYVGEYTLDNWEIKSSPAHVRSLNISAYASDINGGLYFRSDGKELYIVDAGGDNVRQYSLSTGFNISTATYTRSFSPTAQDNQPSGISFKPDGTKMYISGAFDDNIYQYSLSTPWNISTATYDNKFKNVTDASMRGIFIKTDGTGVYYCGGTGEFVAQYDLTTPWDISTASNLKTFSITNNSFGTNSKLPQGVAFNPNGSKMFVADEVSQKIYEYSLSSSWDISTASYSGKYYGVANINGVNGGSAIVFKPDGTKMFTTSSTGYLHEFSLIP